MMVVSMIVLAVGSAVNVTLRAAEANRNPSAVANQAATGQSAVEQLQSDLKVATGISNQSATGITMTVPDRTGDGLPETIIYSWAGAGTPVKRQFNNQPAVSLADNVQNFSLAYNARTVGQASSMPVEGAEQTLVAQNSLLASSSPVTATAWAAESFKVSLVSNATSFKITHVLVSCHGKSAALLTAKIQPADAAGLPLPLVLGASSAVSATTITGLLGDGTLDFSFGTGVANLNPLQTYCVVISSSAAGTGVNHATLSLGSNMWWTTTTNSGTTWATAGTAKDMQFTVFGKVTTQ
jgi:hypothetical protein